MTTDAPATAASATDAAFPPPEEVAAMMRRAGLEPDEPVPLVFGACHIFAAEKPC